MKKTSKYIKTRGQRLALEQATSKPFVTAAPIGTQQRPSSALVNHINQSQSSLVNKKRPYKKRKTIAKEQPIKLKQKKTKLIKQKIVRKFKIKKTSSPNSNSLIPKKYLKGKVGKKSFKIKLQEKVFKETNQALKQKEQKAKSFKIKLNGSLAKKNASVTKSKGKYVKKQHSLIKVEASPSKIQQNQVSKPNKSVKKQQKGSKSKITVANQDSPSLLNNNPIRLQPPEAPPKKKGRPRKIIQPNFGTKIEERTLDEQKILDSFLQNAIKIRKLKNERQFFECFSRIMEYMRDSWEYGELDKMLKVLPRAEDVLKIGIQITRGIRKQLQIQALNQAA